MNVEIAARRGAHIGALKAQLPRFEGGFAACRAVAEVQIDGVIIACLKGVFPTAIEILFYIFSIFEAATGACDIGRERHPINHQLVAKLGCAG